MKAVIQIGFITCMLTQISHDAYGMTVIEEEIELWQHTQSKLKVQQKASAGAPPPPPPGDQTTTVHDDDNNHSKKRESACCVVS